MSLILCTTSEAAHTRHRESRGGASYGVLRGPANRVWKNTSDVAIFAVDMNVFAAEMLI
jgi:hypothetical protein